MPPLKAVNRCLCAFVLLVMGMACAAPESPLPEGVTLVLIHATVVDVDSGELIADQTLWIRDDRIVQVDATRESHAVSEALVLDIGGNYVIPGLWDMHVHWYDANYLPLFIANGVTGVRQMFGSPVHQDWKGQIASGELVGPRQVVASRIVDGPQPVWPGSITAADAEEGRQAVATAIEEGADFVKVYSLLPREAYFAIAEEAKRRGIPFAGHVPARVTLLEAIAAGQLSDEHLTAVLPACSGDEEALRQRRAKGELPWWVATPWIDSYDEKKAAGVFRKLAEGGMWMCPTLTVLRAGAYGNDESMTADPRLRYMPAAIRSMWAQPPRWADNLEQYYREQRAGFGKDLEIVGRMQRAGVRLLAGTDVLNPYCYPGFSLHDELELFVEAGLTPLQALRTATLHPAEFLKRRADLGSLEAGKLADMVVLRDNPLESIKATRSIEGVVSGGRWHGRKELNEMLAGAEARSSKLSISDALRPVLEEHGIETAVRRYRKLRETAADEYDLREPALNSFGYELLAERRLADAIEIFKLNVEFFPESFNVYDSLAEAYMNNGDTELAVRNYRRSLELNPANENARAKLEQLEATASGDE